MAIPKCSECGAELRLRPARCPLCGSDVGAERVAAGEVDPESYQSNVRELREQLRRLRDEGAEAV